MPEFYGVEKEIKALIEQSGDEATYIQNKNLSFDYKCRSSKLKLIRRIYFLLFSPRKKYIKKELAKLSNLKFDILFSINCDIICPYLFKTLKAQNPEMKSALFLWDSLTRYSWENEIALFNNVFTFEKPDAEKFKNSYKPNFYLGEKSYVTTSKYDLCFIGKYSPERQRILDLIISQTMDADLKYYFHLLPSYKIAAHNSMFYSIFKKLKFQNAWIENYLLNYEAVENMTGRDYITQKSISYKESVSFLNESNVVLDIPFEGQSGLTHRVIEALSSGKKVITTNRDILKETFFNPDQIKVFENNNPVINIDWIRERKSFEADSFFSGLKLPEWLNSLLNVGIA